jgi:Na+/melibiose symporter-like transporter
MCILSLGLFWLPSTQNLVDEIMLYIILFVRSFGTGVVFLIPLAMLPDICAIDEKRSGKRREGMLYSILILIEKAGLAICMSSSNYAVGIAGYSKQSAMQPEAVLWTLKVLVALMPVICMLLSGFFLYKTPTREEISAIVNNTEQPDHSSTGLATIRRYTSQPRAAATTKFEQALEAAEV